VTDHREPTGSARDRLRAVHDRQLATLAGYLAADAKLDRARAALQTVEADQTLALGELAEITGVDTAGDLTGLPRPRVREALAEYRRHTTAADQRGVRP
jgi:outer membrane protein TolC